MVIKFDKRPLYGQSEKRTYKEVGEMMRIQHNISALNTHRNLGFNNTSANKALEKLSSGYKINRAGDDAAGLAISEKMRGQIRGLNMAQKNAQDGISLIQTAEGALNEVHAMLQRGRELSVQAANDTNEEVDRKFLQMEIDSIRKEITSVSQRTEFNTKKILQGSGAQGASADQISALMTKLQDTFLEAGEKMVNAGYGLNISSPKEIDVHFVAKDNGNTLGWVTSYYNETTGVSAKWELTLDTIDVIDNNMSDDELAELIAHEMTHAIMSASGMDWRSESMPKWFKEGTAEYLTGGMDRLKNDLMIQANSGNVTNYASDANIENLLKSISSGSTSNSTFYSASYATTRYLDQWISEKDPTKSIKDLMTELKTPKTLDQALQTVAGTGNDLAKFTADLTDVTKGVAFVKNFVTTDTTTGSVVAGVNSASDILGNYASNVAEADNFKYKWNEESTALSTVVLQIGANEGQTVEVKLPNISNQTLSIDDVDITSHENASAAITSFDKGIEYISKERSYLGAIQNRLEHTINNLGAASENLTAAESRIRDTDMAKEMMNFTKQNILMQAAQSMLAQANQQPQGVLQLLG